MSNKSDTSDVSGSYSRRNFSIRAGSSKSRQNRLTVGSNSTLGNILNLKSDDGRSTSRQSRNSSDCDASEINRDTLLDISDIELPNYDPPKCSANKSGLIMSYAANTNQGISRNYNEDRVSIILNIKKPKSKKVDYWPHCAFFGIFDGHGGTTCSDYLRDNLHYFVINNKYFPSNPRKALMRGFKNAETHFLSECAERAEEQRRMHQSEDSDDDKIIMKYLDCSGSCAVVALFVEEK